MIHLNPKLSELVGSWLDDITDDKGDTERKKLMHSALREVANQWQVPYMTLQTQGHLDTATKKIKMGDVKLSKLIDEGGDGTVKDVLVLGEKITERLQQAYAIVSLMNLAAGETTINEWARKVIEEKIIQKKAEQGGQDMEKEEKEQYPPEEAKKE